MKTFKISSRDISISTELKNNTHIFIPITDNLIFNFNFLRAVSLTGSGPPYIAFWSVEGYRVSLFVHICRNLEFEGCRNMAPLIITITFVVLNIFLAKWEWISISHHFSTFRRHTYLKSLPVEEKDLSQLIPHMHYKCEKPFYWLYYHAYSDFDALVFLNIILSALDIFVNTWCVNIRVKWYIKCCLNALMIVPKWHW